MRGIGISKPRDPKRLHGFWKLFLLLDGDDLDVIAALLVVADIRQKNAALFTSGFAGPDTHVLDVRRHETRDLDASKVLAFRVRDVKIRPVPGIVVMIE